MKSLALTLAVATLTAVAGMPSQAEACAMRRMKAPRAIVAKNAMKAGEAAEKAGNLHSAIREYERAMNGKGTAEMRADAAAAAARLHLKLGRTGAGINRLKRAVALNPKDANTRVALGAAALEQDPKLASTHLRAALSMKADGAQVQLLLADAFARQGMDPQAAKALEAAEAAGADAQAVAAIRAKLDSGRQGKLAAAI